MTIYLELIYLPYLPECNCTACSSKNINKAPDIAENTYYKNYLKNLPLTLLLQELLVVVLVSKLSGDLVILLSFLEWSPWLST